MKALFQKQEKTCLTSWTNMKSSLETVHKVAQEYTPNILDCKICMFIPSIVIAILSLNLILNNKIICLIAFLDVFSKNKSERPVDALAVKKGESLTQ